MSDVAGRSGVKYKMTQVPVSSVVVYDNNPRNHGPEQIQKLKEAIVAFGFTSPILIDENKNLIAGAGRLAAAAQLGMDKIPAINVTGLSEDERQALLLADNALGLMSSWDEDKLAIELQSLAAKEFDLKVVGFSEDELTQWLSGTERFPEDNETQQSSSTLDPGENAGWSPPTRMTDGYSAFELVMQHDNKIHLLALLSKIKNADELESNEAALMVLVAMGDEQYSG